MDAVVMYNPYDDMICVVHKISECGHSAYPNRDIPTYEWEIESKNIALDVLDDFIFLGYF